MLAAILAAVGELSPQVLIAASTLALGAFVRLDNDRLRRELAELMTARQELAVTSHELKCREERQAHGNRG